MERIELGEKLWEFNLERKFIFNVNLDVYCGVSSHNGGSKMPYENKYDKKTVGNFF